MNLYFKKYFWTIKLGAVALLALMVAGGINDILFAPLFYVPKAPALSQGGSAAVGERLALGRVEKDEDAVVALVDRRIFNLDGANKVIEEEPTKEEPEVVEDPPSPEGELEESSLPIDLIGTMVAADTESSMATLQIEGKNKIAWVGSEFLEGKAQIARIAARFIVIKEEKAYTVVKLWDDKKAGNTRKRPTRPTASARPTSPATSRPSPTKTPSPSVSARTERAQRIREGVKKTGAYDYQVSRSMIDEELKDMAKLQSEARVVPHYKNQKYEGFKLVGVRPGSLYRAIGIRSGDVITAVNGTAIDNPAKAIELFQQLKNASDIKVEIERRGQPKTLGYAIQ